MSKRVALVTGAASGIGRAIALRLANDGFEMAVCDLPQQTEALETLCQEINQARPETCVSMVIADVSVETEVKAMIANVVENHGGLDVMVANAGILLIKPLVDTSVEDWDLMFSVNTRGVFLCYKYAGLQMIKQGKGGRIVGACSVAGKRGIALLITSIHAADWSIKATPSMSAYSSAKFAVRGLTQAAAMEFGHHGITVNAYAPGAVNTSIFKDAIDVQEFLAKCRNNNSTRTNGEPEDIAGLVSYLASSESKFMTGQTVTIDGGRFFD